MQSFLGESRFALGLTVGVRWCTVVNALDFRSDGQWLEAQFQATSQVVSLHPGV